MHHLGRASQQSINDQVHDDFRVRRRIGDTQHPLIPIPRNKCHAWPPIQGQELMRIA